MDATTSAVLIASVGALTTLTAGLGAAHISSKRSIEAIRVNAEESRTDRDNERRDQLHLDVIDWALRCYRWAGEVGGGFSATYPGDEFDDLGRTLLARVTLVESPAVHSAFMRFHTLVLLARELVPSEGLRPFDPAALGAINLTEDDLGRAAARVLDEFPRLLGAVRTEMGLAELSKPPPGFTQQPS